MTETNEPKLAPRSVNRLDIPDVGEVGGDPYDVGYLPACLLADRPDVSPDLTGLLLGVSGFAGQIPAFFLAPIAGVWIDRWNRHRTLVVTQILSMVQSFALAALAAQFPDDYSRDPSDRLIGATARAEGLTLITRDEKIRRSPLLRTVW